MKPLAAAASAALVLLAAATPAGAELLAASDDGLWLIGDDGTGRTAIPGGGGDPAWTADGARFAVTIEIDDDRTLLQVGRVDGSERTTVAGSEGLRDPSWSPDGQTLVAVREHESDDDEAPPRADLVLLPAAGGTPRVLSSGAYDHEPAWSPTGAEIAFTRMRWGRLGAPSAAVMAIRPDGSGLRRVVGGGDGTGAAWSPDGGRLAYSARADVHVVNADGSGGRRLTGHPAWDGEPSWSPDGTRIAFASTRHYPSNRFSEVWAMDADGSCVTQLTYGSDRVGDPAWRPAEGPVARGPCGVRLAPYHDGVDLGRVRVRDTVPLYPGRVFEGMRLSHAEGALIVMDECDLPVPSRCLGEIQLQSATTCARNPTTYDSSPRGVFPVRGALVVDWEEHYDVLSGGTTTTLYGRRPRRVVRRIVAALRPIRGPANLDRPLPRARLPRRAWRALRAKPRMLRAFRRHGSRLPPACER